MGDQTDHNQYQPNITGAFTRMGSFELIFNHPTTREIAHKLERNIRLSAEDALRLFAIREPWLFSALIEFLSIVRYPGRPRFVHYVLNRAINYTNVCIGGCRFCSFSRPEGDTLAYVLDVESILQIAKEAVETGATELHIVGGLHPTLPYEYYLRMLRAVKTSYPSLHLKCFTAPEIVHISKLAGKPMHEILAELRDAGMDSLAGGGAEIFSPDVRSKIAPKKISANEYLEVHATWHKMGGKSTCTMLYGHIETPRDRVMHMELLRQQQDETGGFLTFVPLPFHPRNNNLGLQSGPSGWDTIRTIAIARLYLDNFQHITAYWIGLGVKLAQVSLLFGADDLNGSVVDERIFKAAGRSTPDSLSEAELVQLITEAGFTPVRRDSLFNPLKIWDATEQARCNGRTSDSSPSLTTP